MGILDFFNRKKKTPHYDVTDIRITDLEKDYILDYDLESWIVTKMYEYDWGNNFFTREFVINNGAKNLYLHIEDDDELEISVTKKIGIRTLGEHIVDAIEETEKPPKKIVYDNQIYYRDSENMGFVRNVDNEDWSEVISWLYLDDTEELLITIEQTGESNYEATIGEYISEYKVSNILPQNTTND
ncbi:DUF4178 domain-containing protein [Aquimarina longa]|uniref:DUF4178 domain-containing protein n=1 Tax=Aquimarina longa TaxID=1080221 RepID=UPI0007815F50|nr:DUF4178 domain-containing protein [Aquimarina longa]